MEIFIAVVFVLLIIVMIIMGLVVSDSVNKSDESDVEDISLLDDEDGIFIGEHLTVKEIFELFKDSYFYRIFEDEYRMFIEFSDRNGNWINNKCCEYVKDSGLIYIIGDDVMDSLISEDLEEVDIPIDKMPYDVVLANYISKELLDSFKNLDDASVTLCIASVLSHRYLSLTFDEMYKVLLYCLNILNDLVSDGDFKSEYLDKVWKWVDQPYSVLVSDADDFYKSHDFRRPDINTIFCK